MHESYKSIAAKAKEAGLKPRTVLARIQDHGWSLEEALSTPVRKPDTTWQTTGIRKCTACTVPKPVDEFNKIQRRGKSRPSMLSVCKQCASKTNRDYRRALRLEVLSHYSGGSPKCALCPDTRIEALDLDHIHGIVGGRNARETSITTYLKVRRDGYPPTFRVLCKSCNWIEYLRRTGKL